MATDSATTIAQWLRRAAQAIAASGSDSARLDAQLLLAHVLEKDRTWLFTWSDQILSNTCESAAEDLLQRRLAGEPIAYILGYREFWSLKLATRPSTLIPRADTETLVEWALELALPDTCKALDLGTGTGAIALALASERPDWQVDGVDWSEDAVALAQQNATSLALSQVRFWRSDWFDQVSGCYDLVVSNPPYIDPEDTHLEQGDVRFEPRSALTAEGSGLADLEHIILNAREMLRPGGWLLLEHGYDQADAVSQRLQAAGYLDIELRHDLSGQPRISGGRWQPDNRGDIAG